MARPKKNATDKPEEQTVTKRRGRPKKNPVVDEEVKTEIIQAVEETVSETVAEPVKEEAKTEEVKLGEVVVETPVEEVKPEEIVVAVPESKKRGRKPKSETAEKAVTNKSATKKTTRKAVSTKAEKTVKTTKTAVKHEIKAYIQGAGAEKSIDELSAKAVELSGVKSPKSVKLYIKPYEEDGNAKVYYVVDNTAGHFNLF
ncbi:MAG: hypothetical protein K2J08_13010 [Ruminococcus sp.]|nr:hypothetical protein [Ruminococcus sp.]